MRSNLYKEIQARYEWKKWAELAALVSVVMIGLAVVSRFNSVNMCLIP